MTTKTVLCVLAISCTLLVACNNKGKADKNADTPAVETRTDAQTVPFVVAERYFVSNAVTETPNPKITTQEEFDKTFGMATVMGEGGQPTPIDFSLQYVVAVIKDETNISTSLSPVSLQKNAEGKMVFTYKTEKGEAQSYTTRPALVIIVDKDYDGEVELVEII